MALTVRNKTQISDERSTARSHRIIIAIVVSLLIVVAAYLGRISYLTGRSVDSLLGRLGTQYAHTLDARGNAQLSDLSSVARTLAASGVRS